MSEPRINIETRTRKLKYMKVGECFRLNREEKQVWVVRSLQANGVEAEKFLEPKQTETFPPERPVRRLRLQSADFVEVP